MRLLQLRFKNLNSLVGEWHIDFTHPAYADAGIFAITGPTGAGKSTILDAICLALYGRTPRLGKISAGSNEILSRQHAECFAEVEFSNGHGHYRCHWSQRRARGQAAGNLQQPRQELVDAASGTVLFSKIGEVAQALEEITGMDFERFTRSILLAQGGFDAFLKADADQRAPILEQLTGTDIYSQISIHIHQRRGIEAQQLEQLRGQLSAMRLLTPADLAALQHSHASCHNHCQELEQQRLQLSTSIAWWQRLQCYEQERALLSQDHEQLAQDEARFEPQGQALQRALQALELSAPAQAVQGQREQVAQLKTRHGELEQQQTDVLLRCEQTQQQLIQASQAWQQAEQAWPAKQAQWREARRLDTAISVQRAQLEQSRQQLHAQERDLDERQLRIQNIKQQQQAHQEQLQNLSAQRTQHAADARLVTELGALEQRFQQLQERYQEHQTLRQQEQEIQAQIQRHHSQQQQQRQHFAAAELDQQRTTKAWQQAQQHYQSAINERHPAQWRQHLNALHTNLQQGHGLHQLYQRLQRCRSKQQQLDGELGSQRQQLQQHQERYTWLEEKRQLLLQQQLLQQRIADLSQLRHQLHPGEACPLCGATEHPYAEQLPTADPSLDPAEQELAQQLIQTQAQLKHCESLCIGSEKALQLQQQEERELEQEIQRSQAELNHHFTTDNALNWSETTPQGTIAERLEQQLHSWRQQQQHAAQQLERLEQAQSELDQLAAAKERATNHWHQQQTLQAEQQARQQQLNAELADINERQHGLSDQIKRAGQSLKLDLQIYGISELSAHTLEATADLLAQRRSQWLALEQQHQVIERELEKIHHQLGTEQSQAETLSQTNAALAHQLGRQNREFEQLQQARRDCLEAADVDLHEQQALTHHRACQQLFLQTQKSADANTQALSRLQADSAQLNQAIQQSQTTLNLLQADFVAALTAQGFHDELDYHHALLPTDQRQALQQQVQELQARKHRLAERDAQLQQQYSALQSVEAPNVAAEQLQHDLDQIEQQFKQQQQQLGRLQHQLDEQHELGKAQAQRQSQLAEQERRFHRWEELHRLIGSSDGKKYRNFVQGLTFDRLINQANRELQRMSSRYLLSRAPDSSLELNVIDHFQAGEQRSAKNLSGGESFIISLALALGLSHMASHKVRVDSLFLDEGFGTLDEDALELALDTLSSLHQEGKLIGLISHVTALKERIVTQIQVQPTHGGRSQLHGPGCRLLK